MASFYDCADRDMDGKVVPMSAFSGKVLLVVNVASYWGYTKDYTDLPRLFDKHGSRGFRILAFPCNQFAKEEPGSHEEILEFVKRYDPDMPSKLDFFEKADVNGPNEREVYKFLKRTLPAKDGSTDISWNFEKFLIDHSGNPVMRYAPNTPPMHLEGDINELLNKKEQE